MAKDNDNAYRFRMPSSGGNRHSSFRSRVSASTGRKMKRSTSQEDKMRRSTEDKRRVVQEERDESEGRDEVGYATEAARRMAEREGITPEELREWVPSDPGAGFSAKDIREIAKTRKR